MFSSQKLDFSFEIKSMGISYYAPLLVILLSIIYVFFSSGLDAIEHISHLLEFVVCPFAAWWSIYLFFDYYEDRASEVLFSYPLSSFFHGILRVTSFFILFLIGFFILLLTITLKNPSVSLMDISINYIPQAMLYSYLGFTLMIVSRNIIFPLLLIIGYIAMKYFTMGGSLFPIYNVMSFSLDMSLSSKIVGLCLQNIVISIFLAIIGHITLLKRKI
ncbi:hypothetical protein KXS12_25325 [Priestia filamentosa]|uniref:hypothetical protein n=1 Tax=Priestia filamentosa TaxID=1402861 RepID=UPI003F14E8E7